MTRSGNCQRNTKCMGGGGGVWNENWQNIKELSVNFGSLS